MPCKKKKLITMYASNQALCQTSKRLSWKIQCANNCKLLLYAERLI